jgi:squalene-hopene/tetraprenyl-beta-curcumene cyclase
MKITSALLASLMTLGLTMAASSGEPIGRQQLLDSFDRGARFLLSQQHPNGAWGAIPGSEDQGELGITALVVTGLAEAPIELRGRYRAASEKAARWIASAQNQDGSITQARSGLTTYRTALGLMALKAVDAKAYATAIKQARVWLETAQFDERDALAGDDPHYGGWGYDKEGTKPDADLSNASMAMQALKASGLSQDDPVFKRALAFVTRCQNNSETNKGVGKLKAKDDGGFFYDPGLSRNKSMSQTDADGKVSFESYAGMTYAGLMSLLHAGVAKDDPRVVAALRWIKGHFDLDVNTGLGVRNPKKDANKQGLFYYYLVFAKALDLYGEPTVETAEGPQDWCQVLSRKLLDTQGEDGSWINEQSPRWWEGNPLIPTSYVLNALNRALKYLPKRD